VRNLADEGTEPWVREKFGRTLDPPQGAPVQAGPRAGEAALRFRWDEGGFSKWLRCPRPDLPALFKRAGLRTSHAGRRQLMATSAGSSPPWHLQLSTWLHRIRTMAISPKS